MIKDFSRGYGWNLLTVCLLSIVLFSCSSRHREYKFSEIFTHSKYDEDEFASSLQAIYSKSKLDSNWNDSEMHTPSEILHYTYSKGEYLPLWVSETGNTDLAEKLVTDLENVKLDGLNPEHYHLSAIKQQMEQFKDEKDPSLNAVIAFDTLCTYAYIQAAHDLTFGVLNPKKADSLWFHSNDTSWNPQHVLLADLNDIGKYPELKQFRSTLPTYNLLLDAKQRYISLAKDNKLKNAKMAVMSGNVSDSTIGYITSTELGENGSSANDSNQLITYQRYYGIAPTGKLDEETKTVLARQPEEVADIIDANLERIRWMPRTTSENYIIVDVPMMELFLRRDGKTAMHMNVVVGKPVRQTPSLNSDMQHVVFNPPWGVPPTILKQDVLPGIERSGEAYLQRKDLEVYDLKGHKVDASVVNASNYKSYVFRQPPGDDNALGYVKFNMPNKWNIYLHDTPHRDDFDKPYRAKSSGCVRLQQPQEMAEYILTQIEKRDFNQEKINSIIQTQKTKYEKLKTKLPVSIVYLTAFETADNNQIRFAQDIYKRDGKLVNMLKQENSSAVYAKR